jgi:hypothetical protein
MKWLGWFFIAIALLILVAMAVQKTKRVLMIQTINDKMGWSVEDLNTKTDDELIAILQSMVK